MLCERVLRVLAQRRATVPIWSCQQSQTLVSVRFGAHSPAWEGQHQALAGRRGLAGGGQRPVPMAVLRTLCSQATPTGPPGASGGPAPADQASESEKKRPLSSSSSSPPVSEVSVSLDHGLPQLTVPLPSRNEPCLFTLKPVTHTIGDFLSMLRTEDAGIDRAVIRNLSGVRMSSTTSIQTLLQNDFDLIINDVPYRVRPPKQEPLGLLSTASSATDSDADAMSTEQLQRLGDVRALVGSLYEALNVEEHQAAQEQRLIQEMETLKAELAPLERQREQFAVQAEKRTKQMTWLGLGMMSVQFGILARLTWWEYSWDIMEPVTYFVTYGTAMACYAYFVLTKQDYLLPDVRDRQYLISFHRRAKKDLWDVSKYNSLKEGICSIERDLQRLRDPLHLRLPPSLLAKGSAAGDSGSPGGILGAQINIDNLKNMIKSKLS